ncbi:transposon protein, putative, CACTA, En/Spm sub-class [Cucumis melo var. makuwa]|uniref:Transposon protein, putative, CACTA, En/Spm sub-class n=1 Tax=Cucumis melo var. makuwa TaxID=1194695 RepID=A0A5A7V593_CUCMM|nr:transposon protein, putative, CACTA, En/Spm sub-class [Cucumis melo var. makuwa]
MSERDSRCITQNSEVMVIGESDANGSGDNNFYSVLNEVLHVKYPMGRNVWLFKYRWNDVDSKSSNDRLWIMSLNTSLTTWMNTCHMKVEQAMTNDSDKPQELDNSVGGSSLVGEILVSTPEIGVIRYSHLVDSDEIVLGAEKPISPHAIHLGDGSVHMKDISHSLP